MQKLKVIMTFTQTSHRELSVDGARQMPDSFQKGFF